MKQNDNTALLGIVALLIIGFLLYTNNQKDERIKELEDTLNSNNLITDNIKKQLLQLIESHPQIDEDVRNELEQIAVLIGVQQESKAILSLAKIIENLLKRLFKNDLEFKEVIKNKKNPSFADYLDFAKSKNIFESEDYHLIAVLKDLRNQEAHELNVVKDKTKLIGCFISGIGITITLYNLVKGKML